MMTSFENFLIDKGYICFAFNCKEMKYYKPKSFVISTMQNLGHFYIHKTDEVLLQKIEQGKSVMDEDLPWSIRKGQIDFGLGEQGKPPTLIEPRPKIKVQKSIFIDGLKSEITLTEWNDDAMNIVLSKIDFEQIFKAMYDNSICFEFDFRVPIVEG